MVQDIFAGLTAQQTGLPCRAFRIVRIVRIVYIVSTWKRENGFSCFCLHHALAVICTGLHQGFYCLSVAPYSGPMQGGLSRLCLWP